ncbi:Nif3-like dinuclear metal center hexameric protein [Algivirga pacifica]|uniref:GTP cyclohydrolase 1 type 2 homolog n=1 Tax=Algivirga pacifica TaxID=1162670 RepID=A0ABP9DF75_9BACT
MKVKEVIAFLEGEAPTALQEGYDNAGLITGTGQEEIKGVLFSLDCTEVVVEEAIAKGCNLIVAHHPIVFKGLKRFNGRNYVERTIINAIKNDICIYAIHTNLDNVKHGVNARLSALIGLENTSILAPKKGRLMKLTTFVPMEHQQMVLEALSAAGAGNIGNYSECSFMVEGEGSFKPNTEAKPFIGEQGALEKVKETRIEVILPDYASGKVLSALKNAHPYEEVAYYLQALENTNQDIGSGMVGDLKEAMEVKDFLKHLKEVLNLQVIKYTPSVQKEVKRVAVCGGSGGFLLNNAKAAGADVFVTADYKYHEYFDAEQQIMIADVGHYESEIHTKDLLYQWVSGRFSELACYSSEVNTNPVSYFI